VRHTARAGGANMIVNDWAELAFEHMALAPVPSWERYLGVRSPRGSASVATLVRRMAYGGRKGRRAEKRLRSQVRDTQWTAGFGVAYVLPGIVPASRRTYTIEEVTEVPA